MITLKQECAPIMPGYNELNHLVTSTLANTANFRYVCDVYVNGSSSYVDRLIIPPHPTYGTALFNPARIIENYISKDIDLTTYGFGVNSNSYASYVLKFGESYGSSSTGSTVYPNQVVTGTKYVWNGVYDYEDFVSYSSGTINAGTSSCRFLTNMPSSGDIEFTDNAYLYCNSITSGTIDYAYIVTKDSSNSTINTAKVNNPYKSSGKFFRFCSSPNLINQISPSDITLGGQPIINSTDYAYSIQMFNASNVAVTESFRYTINSPCTKYTKYRIHFLNKLGGYDAFTFSKVNRFTSDVKRETFKQNLGAYNALYDYGYKVSQRAVTQYDTRIQDNVICQSDWLTENQITWLEELVTSPDVYVEKNGSLIPINITTAKHERKKYVNDKLFNLTIEFTYSYNRNRQRF